ncbi:MAG: succinate dehydrogenase, hydrophobic membrane anchor protein, partial [Alteromonas sp.]
MVTNQASMKRDGVQDYVSLRATAAIIFAYSIFMAWYFITSGSLSYVEWRGLFSGLAMKVFTLAALIAVMIHVRIGLWQV